MPVTIDGSLGITTPTYNGSIAAEYLVPVTGFKNRIINGNMSIDQRNAGASITNNGSVNQYSVDRWNVTTSVSSKFTVQQDAGAVTPPAGFRDYLGITSTAATSLGASDFYIIRQQIEGFNTADFNYGTANARTVTLSFWVRSSLTGSFGGALTNDSDAWCPFSYTISAANTWEYKTVTLVGATTGTWNVTNGQGLSVRFSLGIGSNFTGGTAGTWSSSIFSQPSGSTSVVGTNGATFYITGVQLEVGFTATSFDYRPYGTELALCQRYYQKSYNVETVPATTTLIGYCPFTRWSDGAGYFYGCIPAKQTMRTTPTLTFYTQYGVSGNWQDNGGNNVAIVATYAGASNFNFQFGTNTAGSTGQAYGHFTASAEL